MVDNICPRFFFGRERFFKSPKIAGHRHRRFVFLILGVRGAETKVRIAVVQSRVARGTKPAFCQDPQTPRYIPEGWVMYETYFNLTERPFASVPRIDHYYPAAVIDVARNTLIRCLD